MKTLGHDRRWFAVGDAQTTFDRFRQVLAHHGLIAGNGWLASDVGLVAVGDYFDYGLVDAANAFVVGREGTRILQWLTEHPPEQTVVLLGNHDLARVQELAFETDEGFRKAQELARLVAQRPELRQRFFDECPHIPTPEVALRDFSSFMVEQRTLLRRLLLEGRVGLAVAAVRDGKDLLITHAGVTHLDLANCESRATSAVGIADDLEAFLASRVAKVRDAWSNGADAELELSPLCVFGISGHEGGGLVFHRPADPERSGIVAPHWEADRLRARRFDPHTLAPNVLQACGHTSHARCIKEMPYWTDAATARAAAGSIRCLSVDGDHVRYRVGNVCESATSLLLIDGDMNRVPTSAYDILPLDGVRL